MTKCMFKCTIVLTRLQTYFALNMLVVWFIDRRAHRTVPISSDTSIGKQSTEFRPEWISSIRLREKWTLFLGSFAFVCEWTWTHKWLNNWSIVNVLQFDDAIRYPNVIHQTFYANILCWARKLFWKLCSNGPDNAEPSKLPLVSIINNVHRHFSISHANATRLRKFYWKKVSWMHCFHANGRKQKHKTNNKNQKCRIYTH